MSRRASSRPMPRPRGRGIPERPGDSALIRTNRMLRMISRCNKELIRARDEKSLAEGLCRIITNIGGYRLAWVGMVEAGPKKRVLPLAYSGFEKGYLENINITYGAGQSGRGPTGTAIRTGKPSIARNILSDPHYALWRKAAIRRGYSSSIALPIIVGGKAIGALNIYSERPDAFDAAEVRLLREFSHDLAFGIRSLEMAGALSESESRFSELLHKSKDGVLIADADSKRLTFANERMGRFLGYPVQELVRLRIMDIHPKRDVPRVMSEFSSLLSGKKMFSPDIPFRRKDGSVVHADIRASKSCIRGRTCVIGFFADTSEHKRLEAELQASEERYAGIFNNARNCIAVYTAVRGGKDFVIRDFNRAAERTERVSRAEAIGKPVTSVFPGVREFGILDVFRRVWRSGRPERFPARIYKDKRIAGWRDNYVFRLGSGEVVAIYADLTREKQAEERFQLAHESLRESEQKFRTLANSSLQGIIIAADNPIRILYTNPAMARILGYRASALTSMPPASISRLIHPEDAAMFFRRFRRRLRGKKTTPAYEFRGVRKDGRVLWFEVSSVPIRYMGRPALEATFIDITARRSYEDALRLEKEKVEELSQMKERFMADMTHELKTPLSVIMLNLDMVRNMDPAREGREISQSYELMWRNLTRLSISVEQIMQLTKLDSVSLTSEKFHMDDVMHSVLEDYLPLARSKGLELDLTGKDIEVKGDPHLLSMAISNLVSNAIKFTYSGGIRVVWEERGPRIVISVSDSGVGIRPENRQKVFNKFFKENHNAPGSGIGLAVSSALIKRMGGRIEFKSVPGRGSTFKIIIPKVAGK